MVQRDGENWTRGSRVVWAGSRSSRRCRGRVVPEHRLRAGVEPSGKFSARFRSRLIQARVRS
eukprot:8111575-Prorocentrum_lima.AAC.1